MNNTRWIVQQKCPLAGWNTWVIYDEEKHASNECARRIREAAPRDKSNWRYLELTQTNPQKPISLDGAQWADIR